jgi:hypothetical protein
MHITICPTTLFSSQITHSSHCRNQITGGAILQLACFSQSSPSLGMMKRGIRAHAKHLSMSTLETTFSFLSYTD